jgi:hypothetical protein
LAEAAATPKPGSTELAEVLLTSFSLTNERSSAVRPADRRPIAGVHNRRKQNNPQSRIAPEVDVIG